MLGLGWAVTTTFWLIDVGYLYPEQEGERRYISIPSAQMSGRPSVAKVLLKVPPQVAAPCVPYSTRDAGIGVDRRLVFCT